MSMPGVMTRFVIRELSGVDRPAQAGARAVLMKRANSLPGEDEDEGSDGDIKKMIARGAEIQKVAGRKAAERAEPGDLIDWAGTAKAHATEFEQMAKARAKEKGLTFFQAYHQVLDEHPDAARRMLMG